MKSDDGLLQENSITAFKAYRSPDGPVLFYPVLYHIRDNVETFFEFADQNTIIDLLIKERAKCATNDSLKKNKKSELAIQISSIMPPRNNWHRIRKDQRKLLKEVQARNEKAIRLTINADLRKFKDDLTQAPTYLQQLLAYVEHIQDLIRSDQPLDFSQHIKIIPKFKETDDAGNNIFRPITIYTSLDDKILISLSCSFMMKQLDPYLHEEILSYRPARDYHGEEKVITSGEDAIFLVQDFIQSHRDQDIYVAECDIQKFFDVINHNIVLDCFQRIYEQNGLQDTYPPLKRILEAYLNSYSYMKNILKYNEDRGYWQNNRSAAALVSKGPCLFKWVKDDDLKLCYDEQELAKYKDQLGISQGGALSCLIANVVMNDVDSSIVDPSDPDQLYVRYGDDVLMMHTDKEKCESMIEQYRQELVAHKLTYHPFTKVSDLKEGTKVLPLYWHTKSKYPFKWNSGEGDSAEWIGFVGYEIRYTGEVRLRLSTLNKRFGDINKKYHYAINQDIEPRNISAFITSSYNRMKSTAYSLEKFKALTFNHYSIEQAKSLDRYRHCKLRRMQNKMQQHFGDESLEYRCMIDEYDFLLRKAKDNSNSYYARLKNNNH